MCLCNKTSPLVLLALPENPPKRRRLDRVRRLSVSASSLPEEDARLMKLKEIEDCSEDEIEGAFTNRGRATLQVHYSSKLTDKVSSLGNGRE
jgi:hypothetical protein